MRPTWYAATMVLPWEKVSGSTFAWWFVVAEALQVACVKGSVPIPVAVDAAEAVPESTLTPRRTAAAAATRARLLRPNRPALRDMGPPDAAPEPGATRPGGP